MPSTGKSQSKKELLKLDLQQCYNCWTTKEQWVELFKYSVTSLDMWATPSWSEFWSLGGGGGGERLKKLAYSWSDDFTTIISDLNDFFP